MLETGLKHHTLALLTCTGVGCDGGPVHYQCPQWCSQSRTGIPGPGPGPEAWTPRPSSSRSFEETLSSACRSHLKSCSRSRRPRCRGGAAHRHGDRCCRRCGGWLVPGFTIIIFNLAPIVTPCLAFPKAPSLTSPCYLAQTFLKSVLPS